MNINIYFYTYNNNSVSKASSCIIIHKVNKLQFKILPRASSSHPTEHDLVSEILKL